eukprot:6853875-Pyramimonas_sp.AAC.1
MGASSHATPREGLLIKCNSSSTTQSNWSKPSDDDEASEFGKYNKFRKTSAPSSRKCGMQRAH